MATPQAWGSEPHDSSQLPLRAGPANVFAMRNQAGANENQDAIHGAETADSFRVGMNNTDIARVALGYRPENNQASDMESIKALLRNFLDGVKEPQMERSLYFDGLLSQWLDVSRGDRKHALLVYVLGDGSEQYKDRKFHVDNLETMDEIKKSVLEQQCLQQGVHLHLAKMTSVVDTDPVDALGVKIAISLHEISELNGVLLVNKPVPVAKQSIIQKSFLKERYDRTNARRYPYPSPEGTPPLEINTAKSFHDWVLVIMPEEYQFKFLTDNADPQALHAWIKTSSANMITSETNVAGADPKARWGLALACKTQLNNISAWLACKLSCEDPEENERQSNMLETVVCASLRLRDPDLFRSAITPNPRIVSLTGWEEVGSAMELAHFYLYRESLNQALMKIDSFQDRYIILWSIRTGCGTQKKPQECITDVDKWIEDQLRQALNEIVRIEDNDGAMLVLVAKNFPHATSMNRILAFAKKHSYNQTFATEFAFSLYDELVRNTIDTAFARYALAEILSTAVPAVCGQPFHDWSLHQQSPFSALANVPAEDLQRLQADHMARLVRCCLTVDLYNEEIALLRHMWLGASLADAPTLQHVFLPYLKQLLAVIRDHLIPLTTQIYQWQFQHIVSLFITHYIGNEPTPPFPDFTCPPLGCASPRNPYGCSTCLELDAFLVDPHRKTAEVIGGIEAPEHVSTQIQGTDYLQMTVVSHSAVQMRSTIRITKNITKPEEPDAIHDMWKERVVKANGMIQAICGDGEWKMLLGDRYDECMGLKLVRVG